MIYDPNLRGVLRYFLYDEDTRLVDSLSADECAAYIRAHWEAAEGCCRTVSIFDMDGYEHRSLWRFVDVEYQDDWMRNNGYALHVVDGCQLPMFEQGE